MKIIVQETKQEVNHTASVECESDDIPVEQAMDMLVKTLMAFGYQREAIAAYFDDRKKKGFNVIQVMVLHTLDVENVYGSKALINDQINKLVNVNYNNLTNGNSKNNITLNSKNKIYTKISDFLIKKIKDASKNGKDRNALKIIKKIFNYEK